MIYRKHLITLIIVATSISLLRSPAQAGINWRVVGALLCTAGAIATAATGGAAGVGVALAGAQATLLSTGAIEGNSAVEVPLPDVYEPGSDPQLCSGQQQTCAATDALLAVQFQHHSLDGLTHKQAQFVSAVNQLYDDHDVVRQAYLQGLDDEDLASAIRGYGSQLQRVATAFKALDTPVTLTPEFMEELPRLYEDGMPDVEEAFWTTTGLNDEQLGAVRDIHRNILVRLSAPVMLGDVLEQEAAALVQAQAGPDAGPNTALADLDSKTLEQAEILGHR